MRAQVDEATGELKAMVNHHRPLVQGAAAQHLSLLRREGVVSGRREAQSICCRSSTPRADALMGSMLDLRCSAG